MNVFKISVLCTGNNKNPVVLFHDITLTTGICGPFNHVCMPTEFDVNQGL